MTLINRYCNIFSFNLKSTLFLCMDKELKKQYNYLYFVQKNAYSFLFCKNKMHINLYFMKYNVHFICTL